ncbi:MAG: ATPase [Spirochaetaceae bacterium]|jgi:vacuolar-type H+-ATPase subunit E/Vma4|nr:ATPase [Spirochaetaceae bacterium]
MEELQSLDVLDREILEDARKKADRVLKAADDTLKTRAGEWASKTETDVAGLALKSRERLKQARDEIMARLPLERRRIGHETIETLLAQNTGDFFRGLPRQKILFLLERELAARAAELPSLGLTALFRGLAEAEADAILGRVLPPGSWTRGKDAAFEKEGAFPAIRVDSPFVRVTASIDMLAETLLEEKRAELAGALFGPLVPDLTAPDTPGGTIPGTPGSATPGMPGTPGPVRSSGGGSDD